MGCSEPGFNLRFFDFSGFALLATLVHRVTSATKISPSASVIKWVSALVPKLTNVSLT
jgi:hypothetical protein